MRSNLLLGSDNQISVNPELAHWDVHNPPSNPRASHMTRASKLPVAGDFDRIWLL
jgi:hypothetical protein